MEKPNGVPQKDDRNVYARWLGFGIEFCGVIAVFCYMGYRLDKAWDTSPWFLLAGFFLGFTGMLYLTVKQLWDIWRK